MPVFRDRYHAGEVLAQKLRHLAREDVVVLGLPRGGVPVAFDQESPAGRAYLDSVARFVGEQREMRFVQPERRSIFRTLFGRA